MAELFHKVVGPVVLSEQETAQLMHLSDGRRLSLSFGSRVLLNANDSPWAIPLLATMRGIGSGRGVIVWGASEHAC